jgi:hypothetical protein
MTVPLGVQNKAHRIDYKYDREGELLGIAGETVTPEEEGFLSGWRYPYRHPTARMGFPNPAVRPEFACSLGAIPHHQ